MPLPHPSLCTSILEQEETILLSLSLEQPLAGRELLPFFPALAPDVFSFPKLPYTSCHFEVLPPSPHTVGPLFSDHFLVTVTANVMSAAENSPFSPSLGTDLS